MAGGLGPDLGPDAPHLPNPAPIDAYGNGGFRFGGMSHRGSLLCFPDGIWAWPVAAYRRSHRRHAGAGFGARRPARFFHHRRSAPTLGALPARLRERFRAVNLSVDPMATGPAVRTYNILLAENRRVGAGLIAVD